MAATSDIYQLCQSLLQPTEVTKVASHLSEEHGNSSGTVNKILAVVANVESGTEEAALLSISTSSIGPSINAAVPIYSDFKVSFEQVGTDQVALLESAGKPVQARFQAKFTSDGGRASASVTTSDLAELEDLLKETRRLTEVAEQHSFSSTSSSHVWLPPYLASVPYRPKGTPSSPSAVSTLFSYGNKAIEGLPGLASTFGSFGFLSGAAVNSNANAKSRGLPSAMSIFGSPAPAGVASSAPPLPRRKPRASLNKDTVKHLSARQGEFTKQQKIKVHVCTYNTNGQFCDPNADLAPWIRPDEEPDLLVVGLQEMDLRPEVVMVRHDPLVGEAWSTAILACLHRQGEEKGKYLVLDTKQLAGIWVVVVIREELLKNGIVAEVTTTSVMTGWAGFAGNKGACCVRLRVYDTYLCFICAHLAAFQDSTEKRNSDYRDIVNRAVFSSPAADSPTGFSYSTVFDSHLSIFFGDLNYRLDQPIEHIRGKVAEEQHEDLLVHDQLKRSQKEGLAFEHFQEADINFPPSYKYDKGTDQYDTSEKERKPAWTDRVLWKKNKHWSEQGDGGGDVNMECKQYTAIKEMRMSDHKPVVARLELEIQVVDEAKREAVVKEIQDGGKA